MTQRNGAGQALGNIANFEATPGQRLAIRTDRYRLRDTLNEVSKLKRCRQCGARLSPGSVDVPIVLADLVAHFANLLLCGSVWACPVCAPRIREVRAREVEKVVAGHMGAGGGALFLTLTLPHDQGDRLKPLFEAVAGGWRSIVVSGTWKRKRSYFGIEGIIRAIEITHGENGWHPHLHGVLLTARPLDPPRVEELSALIFRQWSAGMSSRGFREPTRRRGIHLEPVRSALEIAEYTAKFEKAGQAHSVGRELTRHDTKQARRKGRTPIAILRDFSNTGDVADLALWHEYEVVTKGRSSLRFSPGLKKRYDVEEVDDSEIVNETIGGEILDVLTKPEWKWVRKNHLQTLILEAAEDPEKERFATVMTAIRDAVPE